MRNLLERVVSTGLLLVITLFFANTGIVQAQSASESITEFSASVNLDSSGQAQVHENIRYNFGSNERHGILRTIPTRSYTGNEQGYEVTVDVQSITQDGQTVQYQENRVGDNDIELRIGDPDKYMSGEHTYVLSYTIGPVAISSTDGYEIVRLNFPGNQWEIPIDDVSVTIASNAPVVSSACYSGPAGSREQNCIIKQAPGATHFSSTQTLQPGESLTVEMSFPQGTFTSLASIQTLEPVGELPAWAVVAIVAGVFALVNLALLKPLIGYVRYRQRRKQELVIPQYEPPADMEPAEIGLLVDNSSSGAELTATIVQLAVKGYLKIVETKAKSWFRKAEYNFVKLKDSDNSLPLFERQIHDALFSGNDTVESKSLPSTKSFREANLAFHKSLKTNLTDKGFYKKASIFSWNLAERMTDEGYKRWAYIEGFREFLKLTEANRMAMLEAPKRKPEQFSQYLPYAIALGVEKQWAEQFKNLQVQTDTWYEGSSSARAMNLSYMTASLSSGLNSVSGSVNQSSGTSGSGGGFSGGGFSGGGGGSW